MVFSKPKYHSVHYEFHFAYLIFIRRENNKKYDVAILNLFYGNIHDGKQKSVVFRLIEKAINFFKAFVNKDSNQFKYKISISLLFLPYTVINFSVDQYWFKKNLHTL